MSMPECLVINALRLERDWSFRELAEHMAKAGVHIPWRTLNYLMTHEDKQPAVRDRTQHKLQKYIRFAQHEGLIDEGVLDDTPELRSHDIATPKRRRRARAVLRTEPVPRR